MGPQVVGAKWWSHGLGRAFENLRVRERKIEVGGARGGASPSLDEYKGVHERGPEFFVLERQGVPRQTGEASSHAVRDPACGPDWDRITECVNGLAWLIEWSPP